MLEGLQKGHETITKKSLKNFKTTICKFCGKEITHRPRDFRGAVPKYCSKECKHLQACKSAKKGALKATKLLKERQDKIDAELREKIDLWCKDHISKYKNITYNRLTNLFNELSIITGLKDARSIMRIYGFTSRKKFVKELLKIYADQV